MDHIVPYRTPTFLPSSATWYKGEIEAGMLFLVSKRVSFVVNCFYDFFNGGSDFADGRASAGLALETLNCVFFMK